MLKRFIAVLMIFGTLLFVSCVKKDQQTGTSANAESAAPVGGSNTSMKDSLMNASPDHIVVIGKVEGLPMNLAEDGSEQQISGAGIAAITIGGVALTALIGMVAYKGGRAIYKSTQKGAKPKDTGGTPPTTVTVHPARPLTPSPVGGVGGRGLPSTPPVPVSVPVLKWWQAPVNPGEAGRYIDLTPITEARQVQHMKFDEGVTLVQNGADEFRFIEASTSLKKIDNYHVFDGAESVPGKNTYVAWKTAAPGEHIVMTCQKESVATPTKEAGYLELGGDYKSLVSSYLRLADDTKLTDDVINEISGPHNGYYKFVFDEGNNKLMLKFDEGKLRTRLNEPAAVSTPVVPVVNPSVTASVTSGVLPPPIFRVTEQRETSEIFKQLGKDPSATRTFSGAEAKKEFEDLTRLGNPFNGGKVRSFGDPEGLLYFKGNGKTGDDFAYTISRVEVVPKKVSEIEGAIKKIDDVDNLKPWLKSKTNNEDVLTITKNADDSLTYTTASGTHQLKAPSIKKDREGYSFLAYSKD